MTSKHISNFISDTVTKPTDDMLQAMMRAEVGDDVFGEDPTVLRLENRLCQDFGMDVGLFCPSGTMSNQIALRILSEPGDEMICSKQAHIYHYEAGGAAVHSGLSLRLVGDDRGLFTAEEVEKSINPPSFYHAPKTSLVSIENTTNKGGGTVWKIEDLKKIKNICTQNNLHFHLDGARLYNAMVAQGTSPADFKGLFDTISICLSKSLGAPVGSVLLIKKEFEEKARRVRKIMGGMMRQSGYLAAAGLYALDHHVDRLSEDHRLAKNLAVLLKDLPFVENVIEPETNILIFSLEKSIPASHLHEHLIKNGIKALHLGNNFFRMVTHLDLTDEDVKRTELALSQYSPK